MDKIVKTMQNARKLLKIQFFEISQMTTIIIEMIDIKRFWQVISKNNFLARKVEILFNPISSQNVLKVRNNAIADWIETRHVSIIIA